MRRISSMIEKYYDVLVLFGRIQCCNGVNLIVYVLSLDLSRDPRANICKHHNQRGYSIDWTIYLRCLGDVHLKLANITFVAFIS